MFKYTIVLTSIIIFIAIGIWGCQEDTPITPEAKGNISVGFSLKAAKETGADVTRINVLISKGPFLDSLDLTISNDSAYGTFSNLILGTYNIFVKIYDDTTLLGTGVGQGAIVSDQTTTVRITITLFSGDLHVIVDWNNPSSIFEDHFNDTSSMSNWHHTTDYRGGGQFEVTNGQLVRTQVGHVFYYNKNFTCGNGIYRFKAKGHWDFFWRGTTQDSSQGKSIDIQNDNGTLTYFESNWSGYIFGYHNRSVSRREAIIVGPVLTDSLNQIKIVDADSTANIYVNNELKMSLVISPDFRNTGFIEIGANHQSELTAFDDIVITRK